MAAKRTAEKSATQSFTQFQRRSAATFTPSFKAFAALDLPITLVRGGATPVPIIDVTEQLAANIPGASEKVVDGADHFLISTHPAACAKIL